MIINFGWLCVSCGLTHCSLVDLLSEGLLMSKSILLRVLSFWWVTLLLTLFSYSPAQAQNQPLLCGSNDAYILTNSLGTTRQVRHLNTQTGANTLQMTINDNGWNGLGVTMDGRYLYMVQAVTGKVMYHDVVNYTFRYSQEVNMTDLSGFNVGAVNPVNNLFYMASYMTPGRWALFRHDGGTGAPRRVGTMTNVQGNGGDFAFDGAGNLYMLASGTNARIYRIDADKVNAGVNASITDACCSDSTELASTCRQSAFCWSCIL